MTDAIKIPPCIFCGHRAAIESQAGSTEAYVYCLDNECLGVGPTRPTAEEAVAAYLKPIGETAAAILLETAKNLRDHPGEN